MNKKLSLQWQLTLITAFLVIFCCIILSYSISTSAVLHMENIEDSFITIFPKEMLSGTEIENKEGFFTLTDDFLSQISDTKMVFWQKSIFITIIVTCISSIFVYFIVGYFLRPLSILSQQVKEVHSKNLHKKIEVKSTSPEIRDLTDTFNGMLEGLNDAFVVQRQFAANAAHELRTPLAITRSKLDVFHKKQVHSREDYEKILSMVQLQSSRLSKIVDVLLEMTDLQSIERSDSISLDELVEEIICDLTDFAHEKNIILHQYPGNARFTGSSLLVYRAIYNLVENAVKYNRSGGSVSIHIKQDTSFATVTIEDTGLGIPEADYEKIFEPFYRIDKSRSRAMGGAGLGLALVREIAQQHGGTAQVLNSSLNGTKIQITFGRRT